MRGGAPGPESGSPLTAALSQALVAYTIEFDNEAEHRIAHRTTNHADSVPSAPARRGGAVWLVSLAMSANCLQFFVGDGAPQEMTVAQLYTRARTRTNLAGMARWGYVTVTGDGAAAIVRPTRAGLAAQGIWAQSFRLIETRWDERFGPDAVAELRAALVRIVARFEVEQPDCMPILRYGLYTRTPKRAGGPPAAETTAAPVHDLALSALLSRVLTAFALRYERGSVVSLAIAANVLRVLDDDSHGLALRELPVRSGVSKESAAMATGYLARHGLAVLEGIPGRRGKRIRLTATGRAARDEYRPRLAAIEQGWQQRFGADELAALRHAADRIVGDPADRDGPLWAGLAPYPDGWRASVRPPVALPHFPMVLHRGGFPDGS